MGGGGRTGGMQPASQAGLVGCKSEPMHALTPEVLGQGGAHASPVLTLLAVCRMALARDEEDEDEDVGGNGGHEEDGDSNH